MSHEDPRVLIVASHLTPTYGLERAIVNLAVALGRERPVEVIVLEGEPIEIPGVECREVSSHARRGWSRIFSLCRVRALTRELANRNGHIVLGGAWAALPFLLVMPRGTPVVVWEHSMTRSRASEEFDARLRRLLSCWLYRRASKIVAVSEPHAHEIVALLRLPNSRVTWIPNIVVEPDWRNEPEIAAPPSVKLVCVGSLTKLKRTELALDLMDGLPEGYTLNIVGDGPLREDLEGQIRRRSLESRVKLFGRIEHSVVVRTMRESTFLVHFAVSETFGYVYLEAAQAEIPIVALHDPVLKWLSDEGLVISRQVADVSGMREVIENMSATPISRENFQRTEAARRAMLGEDAVAARWNELIRMLN